MWLLHTKTFRLKYFIDPAIVEEGYAILSHVWDKGEQSFQDIQDIHRPYDGKCRDPRELICAKTRDFCRVCAERGYEWAWIDTCCIDKTSSFELSEAINSMFRYYSLALVCYVDDVM